MNCFHITSNQTISIISLNAYFHYFDIWCCQKLMNTNWIDRSMFTMCISNLFFYSEIWWNESNIFLPQKKNMYLLIKLYQLSNCDGLKFVIDFQMASRQEHSWQIFRKWITKKHQQRERTPKFIHSKVTSLLNILTRMSDTNNFVQFTT